MPEPIIPDGVPFHDLIITFDPSIQLALLDFLTKLLTNPLSLDPKTHAGVVPLTNISSGGRQEFAIQYFSEDWPKLIPLLTNPADVFAHAQKDWDATVADPQWMLESDITCILQPGHSQPHKEIVFQIAAANKLWNYSHDLYWGVQANTAHIDDLLTVITTAMKKKGAFFAEFAVKTRILTIWYWRPETPSATFSDKLSDGLIAFVTAEVGNGSIVKQRFGTLHFDVVRADNKKPTDEDRAKFVLKCLESRSFVNNFLPGHTGTGDAVLSSDKTTNATFSTFGGTFKEPTTVGGEPYAGPRVVIDRIPEKSLVEKVLTDPVPACFTCCNTNVVELPDGTIELGDMLLKEYCP